MGDNGVMDNGMGDNRGSVHHSDGSRGSESHSQKAGESDLELNII